MVTRRPPLAISAAFLAAFCLAALAEAAVTAPPETWAITYSDLRPTIAAKYKRRYYYQIPPEPKGTVLFFHGCVHSGYNYWPRSQACPECLGLPEEMSHVLQALNRGYAAMAISSGDRRTGCWSWSSDAEPVQLLVRDWLRDQGLSRLPLFGMGISSGASFTMKIPRFLNFSGIVSEALGVDPDDWGYAKVKGGYPPTVFVAMMRDESTVAKIYADQQVLEAKARPVEVIKTYPRLVYPTYFSDRHPYYISKALSTQVVRALRKIGMIDTEGSVILDPRYTTKPWLKLLKAQVAELKGPVTTFKAQYVPDWNDTDSTDTKVAAVYSLMNLAYAYHEIVSDYATAALVWFETGCKADMASLLERYTYGLPPPQYRGQVAAVAEDPLPGLLRARERMALEVYVGDGSGSGFSEDGQAATSGAQRGGQGGVGQGEESAAELLALSEEVEEEVAAALDPSKELPLSVALPQHLLPPASRSRKSMARPVGADQDEQPEGSSLGALLGGMACGAGVAGLLAAAAWAVARHRRLAAAQAAPVALGPATMQAVTHPAPATHHHRAGSGGGGAGSARLSLVPGVKERFEYEVVEQTGSPFSARRRVRTAFYESPRKLGSPQKAGGL